MQNLITTSLGFLDTFMVGLLGSDQMSAVTVANVPVFIIQLVVFGLQSGSSVLISQYWGRGDRESINRVMGIGFMIAPARASPPRAPPPACTIWTSWRCMISTPCSCTATTA